jgi:GWxTD domain-containing protein
MTTTPVALIAALALALLLGATAASGQWEQPEGEASLGGIRFAADVVALPGGEIGGTIEVTYTVTNDALVFLKNGDAYRASFELMVIVFGGGERQVAGDSWRRKIDVETYEETNSKRVAVHETVTLEAPPGHYTVRVRLESLDTRAFGQIDRRLEVPEITPGSLTLGSIVFERAPAGDPPSPDGYVPNPAREFGEDYPYARARFPVYGDPETRYLLELSVLSEAGDRVMSTKDTIVQASMAEELARVFEVDELEVGYYRFGVRIRPLDEDGGDDDETRARFRVVTSSKSWGEDFEKMLAQISIVASRDDYDRIAVVEPEERDAAWEEFWARHDPSPGSPENEFKDEFLRRLGHANAHFRSVVEGWQTDMGRVYIEYGAPDDIDAQPIGKMLNSWEIWYYYSEHTKYIFVDREGFGEYKLVEKSRI